MGAVEPTSFLNITLPTEPLEMDLCRSETHTDTLSNPFLSIFPFFFPPSFPRAVAGDAGRMERF